MLMTMAVLDAQVLHQLMNMLKKRRKLLWRIFQLEKLRMLSHTDMFYA